MSALAEDCHESHFEHPAVRRGGLRHDSRPTDRRQTSPFRFPQLARRHPTGSAGSWQLRRGPARPGHVVLSCPGMQAAARPVPADVWIGLRLFRDDGMCGSWLGADGWTWWFGNFQRSASKPNDDVGPPISDWSAVSPQGEPLERLHGGVCPFLTKHHAPSTETADARRSAAG